MADQSPHLLAVLGARLRAKKSDAVPFMRRVVSAYPADFWTNIEMGNALFDQSNAVEAIGYYRAALALRPHHFLSTTPSAECISARSVGTKPSPSSSRPSSWTRRTLGAISALDSLWLGRAATKTMRSPSFEKRFESTRTLDGRTSISPSPSRTRAISTKLRRHSERPRNSSPRNAPRQSRSCEWLLLKLGRGSELCAAWKEELADHPPEHDDWFGYAELCLFLGDEAEYRRARRDLLAQFGSTADPAVAERTGRACLLLPAAESELEQAVALADRAAAAGREALGFGYPYCLFAQGLARYRQGRFDDAIKLMNGEAAPVMGPSPRLILAMAQYQKGQQDEARKTLAVAVASHDWSTAKATTHDEWINHILRREAESIILSNEPAIRAVR